jgi:opacity protein-like surface antigen
VVRFRLALAAAVLSCAAVAEAQQSIFTGSITAHVGAAHGGDIRGRAWTAGASMAVIEDNGIGVELDAAHMGGFDELVFAESSVTTFMLNVIGSYPHPSIQPFVNAGVGVMRTRAAVVGGQTAASRTDLAFTAGGGLQYMFNELLGVRGDVRYFRYFERHNDFPTLNSGFFDFWRSSVGVTVAWPIR